MFERDETLKKLNGTEILPIRLTRLSLNCSLLGTELSLSPSSKSKLKRISLFSFGTRAFNSNLKFELVAPPLFIAQSSLLHGGTSLNENTAIICSKLISSEMMLFTFFNLYCIVID